MAISNVVVASAAEASAAVDEYQVGESYDIEAILAANGYENLTDETTLMGGRTVKYTFEGNETVVTDNVVFNEYGNYTFTVTEIDSGDESGFTITVKEPVTPVEKTYISGVEYDLEYLLENAGFSKLDGQTTYKGGRKIEYKKILNEDGSAVSDTAAEYEYQEVTTNNIEFKNSGDYVIRTSVKGEGDEYTVEREYIVNVYKKVNPVNDTYNKTSVTYVADVTAYRAQVTENAKDLSTQNYTSSTVNYSNSFEVPSLKGIISSPDFDYDKLQKIVYYCEPNATSYTRGSSVTTSNASFTVSQVGEYSFYVLFQDVFGNEMTTEGLVLSAGGWYEADDDGLPTGDVVIPVFTFEVKNVAQPQIAVKASQEDAFINLSYEIKAFTITANDYSSVYELYYLGDKKIDKTAYTTDEAYIAAVKAEAEKIGESAKVTDKLDKSSLTFTPDKVGYYYLWTRIVDNANQPNEAMSVAIHCVGTAKTATLDPMFWENNLTAVILLGVAGVCFIAIIVLLFVKPKEAKKVELAEGETEEKENK